MALIVDTADISPKDMESLRREERLWVYNGLDTMVMREIQPKLDSQMDDDSMQIYKFDRAQQGPAMSMLQRGMRVDEQELAYQIHELELKETKVTRFLHRISVEIQEVGFNPNSWQQIQDLLYGKMKLPRQYKRDKGEKKVTTDRNALEKLRNYYWATPIVNCILTLRDINKQIATLRSGVDRDGRMRFGFNPAATETGRWSSSKNPWGRGTNGQNISDPMRRVYISDPGRKLAYVDLEQAESRGVAYLAQDEAYIEAVESGDVHTTVACMVWPEQAWTGNMDRDRAIAEKPYYRHFSRRYMAKRGGHASNYYASPFSLAVNLKIPQKVAEEFQALYFGQFRGIPRWHSQVQEQLQRDGWLITPIGRRRHFLKRRREDSTLREAIAYEPQSLIVDIVSLGLLRSWAKYELQQRRVWFHSHQHDGLVYSYEEGDEEVCHLIEEELDIPVKIHGREMRIPSETKVGYAWNNGSLAKLGSDKARKQIRPSTVDVLDWTIA